jgi:hypothetical protein
MVNAPLTVVFDVYGTLVDPAGMAEHLRGDVGDEAQAFATCGGRNSLNIPSGAG